MVRAILRVAGCFGLFAGIAALVLMASSWRDPIYFSHPPGEATAGISIRLGQGMLSVTARGEDGMRNWPGWKGWEFKDRTTTRVAKVAPATRATGRRGRGVARVQMHTPAQAGAVAKPVPERNWVLSLWAATIALFVPGILLALLSIRERVWWYLYCPVCGERIAAMSIACPGCGTRLENGAVPCGASVDLPDGMEISPATRDAASFADSRVVIRGDVARLRATSGLLTFAGCILGCGLGALFMAYKVAALPEHWLSFETIFALGAIIPLIAGLFFVAIALLMVVFHKRMKLDRVNGTLWMASGWPGKDYSIEPRRTFVQILATAGSGSKSYKCYEVNIISGKDRVNVLSHGNAKIVRRDAKTLASFLGVKLLDLTGEVISRPEGSPGYRLVDRGIRRKEVTLASS